MSYSLKNMIFRLLAGAMMMLIIQAASAAVGGAEPVKYAAAAQADRSIVMTYTSRSQTVNQFETLGLGTEAARDRVAAMSDAEVNTLPTRIDAAPAIGDGLVLIVLAGFFIWYYVFRR